MKKTVRTVCAGTLCVLLLGGVAACGSNETAEADRRAAAYEDPHATLTLGETATQNGDISGELFGVFLEDINYASQALDDNMVVNGGFESKYKGKSYGWTGERATISVAADGDAFGDLFKDYLGKNAVADHALVTTEAGGALINSGYVPVPMAVQEGVDYTFSAFMKADADNTVTVTVTDGERDYLSEEISLKGGDWVKYIRTMRASGTASEGLSLRLTFEKAGEVELEGVSLETQDSTVGIKNYLYNAVKELSPKFVRFPGGCIIEGENLEQAYDWKNSIGAVASGENAGDDTVPAFTYSVDQGGQVEEVTTYGEPFTRKTNVNLWENNGDEYFQMDYGIGFYEYFLLCESLNASALPVVNCGKACQGQSVGSALAGRHGKGVADYIRDAADLIEFAKGDKTTKWGAVRAAMGHEAPFEMHYIGIGNEQWDNYYTDYYEKFLEDEYFMGKCEEYGVELIVGNHQQLIHCEGSIDFKTGEARTSGVARDAALAYMAKGNIDSLGEYGVQDHHYYNSPVDFLLHAHMYDDYARTGENRYEVFVGEYSANNTFKEAGNFSSLYAINNWFSALSEAAMMTGFERNGDIVKLAAYAPMFAPVDAGMRHWAVDMMLFTNTDLVRTANYYVQQLFMQNTGSKKIDATLAYRQGFGANYLLVGANAEREVDKLYFVTSLDEKTGDVIVKIVNASEDNLKVNVDLGGRSVSEIADVTAIEAELTAVNSLTETPVKPEHWTIGGYTDVAGVNVPAYSVTAVRFHTK